MLHPRLRVPFRHAIAAALLAFALPARAQTPSVCAPQGALAMQIGAIAPDGTLTLRDGGSIRLANVLWPDHREAALRRKLVEGLLETLDGQRLSWKPVAAPDRWGIVPAFVFVQEPPAANQPDLPPFWLQAGLLEAGLAPGWPEFLHEGCWQRLLEHEAIAIARRRGHWAPRLQSFRLARIQAEPAAQAGRRIVVRWRVASAPAWRDLVFLNMDQRPRAGAAIALTPSALSALKRRGIQPDKLAGERILARLTVPAEGLRRLRLESADHLTPLARSASTP